MSSLKKIQEYLLYLFLFLLPWQTRWIIRDAQIAGGVFEYGRISIYAFDVVFVLLFLASVILRPKAEGSRIVQKKNPLLLYYFITLLLISCLLSLISAPDKILTTYWWLRVAEGLALIYLIKKINFSQTKAALAFIFSITISAAFGIYQFVTQNVFASKWLGMASQNPGDLGVSVVETATGRFLRAYGNLPHPNVLAGFIVVAVVLCFYQIIKIQEYKNTRIQENKKTYFTLLLYYFITLLLIVGLFFTFSRAAWLVFFLFLMGVILRPKAEACLPARQGSRRLIYRYVVISLLLFFCLSLVYLPLIKTRVSNSARLEIKSNTERALGYREAWQIIKQSPLLGVGLGNYTIALQKNNPGQPAWAYQPVHNVYLLALAELGIIIVVPFVSLFLYFLIKNKSEITCLPARQGNQKLGLILYSCIFIFLFFDHFWWTLPSGLLLIFLIIVLAKENTPA